MVWAEKRSYPNGEKGRSQFLVSSEDVTLISKADTHVSKDEHDRGQWSGQLDFLMSMVAYAVGLGNVWRFPYLCFKNGGGSFLCVYALFWCVGAVPIFMLEVTVGQYLQKGGIEVWNIAPILKGVGYGNVVISFMCIWYYCIIVTWAWYYIASSFQATFPWENCGHYWNDDACIAPTHMNRTEIEAIERNMSIYNKPVQTSIEQFWENRVLQQTPSIEETGGIVWELLGINIIVWMIIYFALWKGITNARKFVYFCALSPYVLLFILLIRGLTLRGASLGIHYFLMPRWDKLMDVTVWKDAGTQVFYSYGVGFGTLIALGSHNKYNHNCIRDAIALCVINGMTSMLAGFVVFSILGHMATIAEKSVGDIVKPGVGLAFLAYPEVASTLPLKQLWAVLFFVMLSILGIDSQVCMVEGAVVALEDAFPICRRHKKIFLLILCIVFFLLGIPMLTQAGHYWLTIVDNYGPSGIALLFIVFFEVVGLSWGFGVHNVSDAMQDMIKRKAPLPLMVLWKWLSPLACVILFIILVTLYKPPQYGTGVDYPVWSQVFGFMLCLASMLCIPGYAILYIIRSKESNFMAKLKAGFRSTVPKNRELVTIKSDASRV